MRSLYNFLGWLCVALGIIGIILPLMPTTVFLILASVCFSRGSPQYKEWLLNHPRFGHYIRDYQAGRGIPKKCKVIAIAMIWTSIGTSAIFLVSALWLKVLLLAIAAGVSLYLYWLPSTQLEKCPVTAALKAADLNNTGPVTPCSDGHEFK